MIGDRCDVCGLEDASPEDHARESLLHRVLELRAEVEALRGERDDWCRVAESRLAIANANADRLAAAQKRIEGLILLLAAYAAHWHTAGTQPFDCGYLRGHACNCGWSQWREVLWPPDGNQWAVWKDRKPPQIDVVLSDALRSAPHGAP